MRLPCFNLRFMCLLASIRAYGRHNPRICRRQFTCMLASRQLEILVKTTNFTSKKHTVPNLITSIIHKPSSMTIIPPAKGQMKYCYSIGLMV